jgi:hypothetical protein
VGHPITWGHKYKDLVLQVGGLDARLTTLLCKIIYCCEIQRSETRMTNEAESFKEGCGSKGAVLPMMCRIH